MTESDRALVEQAKGVLMLRYGLGSRESLAVLDRWASQAMVPLQDVADALVTGICQGRVTPESDGTVRWLEQRLRGAADGVRDVGNDVAAPGITPVIPTAPAPRSVATPPGARPEPGQRQWRYTSAVHAARVLHSR